MPEELTPLQAEALEHIKRRIANGAPPTAGELARDMGYTFAGSVTYFLKALARKGFIAWEPGVRRGISVIENHSQPIGTLVSSAEFLKKAKLTPAKATDVVGASEMVFQVVSDNLKHCGVRVGDFVVKDEEGRIVAVARRLSIATEGTYGPRAKDAQAESVLEGRKKAQPNASELERRRKIADAKRGKPRPQHVVEALRAANVGRKLPQEQRAKMSKAHKQRGTIPPKAEGRLWTPQEDEAVRTLPAEEAAAKTGRTLRAVYMRRNRLGMPDARTYEQRKGRGKAVGE